MSHDTSRKQFFGKLLGLAAVIGLAPKLVAKTTFTPESSATPAPQPKSPVAIIPQTRAVARRADSL